MFRMLAPIALALAGTGCVTVYQPLRSLQRPVVVDLNEANFEGVRVRVRCPAGEFVKGGEAQKLCRKVQRTFANQGAIIDYGGEVAAPVPARPGVSVAGASAPTLKPDLIIDLESRLLVDDTDRLFSLLCILTATLVPWVTDTSLAEDITIRDGDGFLLASDSFQARFVNYVGIGVWAVNALLDLFVRGENEKLIGKAQGAVVSRDFYGQLSQLAFHARTRALVLQNFERPK
jgi:hypothetical protein